MLWTSVQQLWKIQHDASCVHLDTRYMMQGKKRRSCQTWRYSNKSRLINARYKSHRAFNLVATALCFESLMFQCKVYLKMKFVMRFNAVRPSGSMNLKRQEKDIYLKLYYLKSNCKRSLGLIKVQDSWSLEKDASMTSTSPYRLFPCRSR